MSIYKIPIDNEAELSKILGTLGLGQLLQGNESLESVFNDVPFSEIPQVVIELLHKSKQSQHNVDLCSPSLAEIPKLPLSTYCHMGNDDPIVIERSAFLTLTVKEKPSRTGTPSMFRVRQLDPLRQKAIPCGHPRDYEASIPTTLLHPVFGQFVDDCQTIEITADNNRFAERLTYVMSALYNSESDRIQAVNKELQSYNIHFSISETRQTGYMTDADVSINRHCCVIAEFKNEMGSTSTEPYFQAIGYYLEWTRESAVKFRRSSLLCLLLAIYGPSMHPLPVLWPVDCPFLQGCTLSLLVPCGICV